MNLGLEGKVAAVSGASTGLGKATAYALAREGALVVLSSRDNARAKAAAHEISAKTGRRALYDAVDVRKPNAWIERIVRKTGRLDILVNNAGGPPEGAASEIDDLDWRKGFELNFLAFARLSRQAAVPMKKGGWGRIVFIASTSAKQPIAGLAVSNAMRAAILGLSKTLSQELGPRNILVNTVCPGYTNTDRLKELVPKGKMAALAQSQPVRRIAEPHEIADVVAFLCSERASYVTGTALCVDGGRTAGI